VSTPKNTGFVLTAFCIFYSTYLFSQEYRNSGFIKPMQLPFNLAGSFGEPRKDHFHSGIDIKTNGVEGEPVFAIGDGYISRIRVSPYGYGRAIYITHTNGFTSVYGHLSKFYSAIENYIHAKHYALKKSELDLTLDPTVFPLKQNDTIAFSGNTGGSSAPHLHFEIRNTKTEHALNPLDFYPRDFYVDTIPPQINKVKILKFYDDFYFTDDTVYYLRKKENYLTTEDSVIIDNYPSYCLSLEGFDKQDNSENKNGIKKIEVWLNNSLVFKYDLTEVDFDKTRMCNAFVDYDEMLNDSGYFYNSYQFSGNTLSMYSSMNKGVFKINNNEKTSLTIDCYDYNYNKTTVKLNIARRDTIKYLDSSTILGYITYSKYFESYINDFTIKIQINTFYDNTDINLDSEATLDKNILSKIYHATNYHHIYIPLHKPAKIEFKSAIKKNRNKVVVVRQDNKGNETALKTTFDKTKFYAETKELGSFYLKYDTTKPIVEILNLKSGIINQNIQVKISDELSGIDTYNGYIDNQWVNFYYDAKNDVIEYKFDEYCSKGEHLLKIIVTDKVGNKTSIEQKIIY
jgi:hypothetical protein